MQILLLLASLGACQDLLKRYGLRYSSGKEWAIPSTDADTSTKTDADTSSTNTKKDAVASRTTTSPSTDAAASSTTTSPSTDAEASSTTTSPSTDAEASSEPETSTPAMESTTPASTLFDKDGGEIRGYYSLSWNDGNKGPKNSNTSVFFNGWNSVSKGLEEYEPRSQPELKGFKYFSFGGGDTESGYLSKSVLRQYIKDIPKIQNKGFQGVMFDIEIVHGSAKEMNPEFAAAFAATKQAGLKVGVTTSHSAPVIVHTEQDAVDFIKAFVRDTNIDVISPQLYENGNERSPQFEPTGDCYDLGCTYDLYKDMHPGMQFAPSITYASQYSITKQHFQKHFNIECAGYFVYYENDRRLDEPVMI